MSLLPGCPDSLDLLHASQPLYFGQPLPVSATTLMDDSVSFNWPQPQGAALRSVVPCVTPAVDMRTCHRTHRLHIRMHQVRFDSQAQITSLRQRPKDVRTLSAHRLKPTLSSSLLELQRQSRGCSASHASQGILIPPPAFSLAWRPSSKLSATRSISSGRETDVQPATEFGVKQAMVVPTRTTTIKQPQSNECDFDCDHEDYSARLPSARQHILNSQSLLCSCTRRGDTRIKRNNDVNSAVPHALKCSKVSRHCTPGPTVLRHVDMQRGELLVNERGMQGDDVVEQTAEGNAWKGTTWQTPQLRDSAFRQTAASSECRKYTTRWRVEGRGCDLHKKTAGALAVTEEVSACACTLPSTFSSRIHQLQRRQPHRHANQARPQRGRLGVLFSGKVTQMKPRKVIPSVPLKLSQRCGSQFKDTPTDLQQLQFGAASTAPPPGRERLIDRKSVV